MSTAIDYPHIIKDNGARASLKSHPRRRVAMIVMDYLARGLGPEDMVRHYPYLKLQEVHAAMAYYYDHQQEIDGEIQSELDQLELDKSKPRSGVLSYVTRPEPAGVFAVPGR